MKHACILSVFSFLIISCSQNKPVTENIFDIIPYPQCVKKISEKEFKFNELRLYTNLSVKDLSDLRAYIESCGLKMSESGNKDSANLFISVNSDFIEKTGKKVSPEGYTLSVNETGIFIEASSYAGIFYGLQTLRQLLEKDMLPNVKIIDYPRFSWRGMHLDVSRHFYDTDFIKKQLEALSYYKINRFHWHLTDGAGWRLEIPQYPLLTEKAAWRIPAKWKQWWFGKKGDNESLKRQYFTKDASGVYGGYYTANDVREIIEYARLRNIEVIPEIEMPGHSEEVLACYPQFSCSGKPYQNSDFCAGNEETFVFIENILSYVIDLFPSQYIHIGGDEAGKNAWKKCPKCIERMASEKLKDADELQSYFIHRIEKFINSKGRKMIGWDEILQGGLAPNASVMSWRGTEGGIKAASSGHDAVMTPGGYCYLDAYQADPQSQPEAIGGYLTIDKVYSYDPAPSQRKEYEGIIQHRMSRRVRKHIIGIQGNVWTEYMPTYEHTEYMIYPRIIAIAETGWTEDKNKSFESFKRRINKEVLRLSGKGYNPYMLSDKPLISQKVKKGYIETVLYSEKEPVIICYTTDGSEPLFVDSENETTVIQSNFRKNNFRYKHPIQVSDSLILTAKLFSSEGKPLGESVSLRIDYHKGIGKKATYNSRIYPDYSAGGKMALTDGRLGGKGYGDGKWQGFCPEDLDVIIDLGKTENIRYVKANFMQMVGPGILFPSKTEVYGSEDGENFSLLCEDICTVPTDTEGVLFRMFGWEGEKTQLRYIRFIAHQSPLKVFIFTDEIIIR